MARDLQYEHSVPVWTPFQNWGESFRKGITYYLRDGRVRELLLWNVWDKIESARNLISNPNPVTESELMGRIPRENVEAFVATSQS